MIIRIFVLVALIAALSFSLHHEYELMQNQSCLHEDHSQFDDGDGANIDFLNENFNEIHKD